MRSQAPGKTSAVAVTSKVRTTGGPAALFAMLAACSAVFLTALDQTVVVTVLPSITTDLQIPIQQLDRAAWIISAYLLGYVIAMPLMGRISDLYGRRRVFIICLGIFGIASLFCGLATTLGEQVDITFLQHIGVNVAAPGASGDPSMLQPGLVWLVAARFVQAAGGGAIIPVAMAVAGDYYGEQQRALALGLVGMVTETGGVLGPLYGAAIVQAFSWRVIFYLNVPLALILMALILWLIKPHRVASFQASDTAKMHMHRPRRARWGIDLPGTFLLGASLICLSLGLSQEAVIGTSSLSNVAPIQNNPVLISVALVLLAAFVFLEIVLERRALRQVASGMMPIIEPGLFRRAAFTASSLVSLLVGAALIIAMADIPLFIATVQGGDALASGLALLRLTVMIPIGALVGGWLCARITCRLTALIGLIPTALGFWLMHLWPIQVDWVQMTISTVVCGMGFGLVIAPISTTAINAVRNFQMGMAASIVTVLRMVGMILGLAALTSWGLGRFYDIVRSSRLPEGMTPLSPGFAAYEAHIATIAAHDVFTSIFLAAGVLCLGAILPACLLEGRRPSPSTRGQGEEQTA
ncbi:MAG TPA: MFS transporter [Ktedonobacteraceae bacterium]|nr:MFS transporter [Ktedonobacteraceae bacterium]